MRTAVPVIAALLIASQAHAQAPNSFVSPGAASQATVISAANVDSKSLIQPVKPKAAAANGSVEKIFPGDVTSVPGDTASADQQNYGNLFQQQKQTAVRRGGLGASAAGFGSSMKNIGGLFYTSRVAATGGGLGASSTGSGSGMKSLGGLFYPTRVKDVHLDTPILPGMVWSQVKNGFEARPLNSCWRCGEPMTFRQAMFDKKMIGMWALYIGADAAQIELNARPCPVGATNCEQHVRAPAYALTLSVAAVLWPVSAYVRDGQKRFNVAGDRRWFLIPLAGQLAALPRMIQAIRSR